MVAWTTPFTIGITSGEYLSTPIIPVGIHSQTIGIIMPQSTYNVVGGGGTRATCSLCSTRSNVHRVLKHRSYD